MILRQDTSLKTENKIKKLKKNQGRVVPLNKSLKKNIFILIVRKGRDSKSVQIIRKR